DVETERADDGDPHEAGDRQVVLVQRERDDEEEDHRQHAHGPLCDRQRIEAHIRFVRRLQDSALALNHRRLHASSPQGRGGAGGIGTTRHAFAFPISAGLHPGALDPSLARRERVPLPPTPPRPSAPSQIFTRQTRSMMRLPNMPYGRTVSARIMRTYGAKSFVPPPT